MNMSIKIEFALRKKQKLLYPFEIEENTLRDPPYLRKSFKKRGKDDPPMMQNQKQNRPQWGNQKTKIDPSGVESTSLKLMVK